MSEMAVVDARDDECGNARSVRLQIPAKPEYIAVARLALAGLLEPSGATEEALADLRLALTEAVTNSIRHAYEGSRGLVEIAFGLSRTHLEIEVRDDGAGFDPECPTTFEGDELVEGGLGIAIIRTLTDELEIESRPGVRGSRLRFVKRLGSGFVDA